MQQYKTFIVTGTMSLVLMIAASAWVWSTKGMEEVTPSEAVPQSPLDISFSFSGRTVTLVKGYAEYPVAPGSATQEVFRVFGTPTIVDLDGDGDEDAIFLVTQEGGGSGTFFFVVGAVNDRGSFTGTNGLYLGDRIAPQTITIDRGVPVVNYADRRPDEPMVTPPSIGKSLWVHFDPRTHEIGEAVQNFEGEASATSMRLPMKKWDWVKSSGGGQTTTPKQEGKFTLTFGTDGQVSVTTDCNGMGGTYTAKDGTLTFSPMAATLMYCEGSQESEFTAMLSEVRGYAFTGKGELELSYGKDGVALFR